MQIDLQEPLAIDSIKTGESKLKSTRYGAAYIIEVPEMDEEEGRLDVYYSGNPKESLNPPYDGGFVWAKDSFKSRMDFGGMSNGWRECLVSV